MAPTPDLPRRYEVLEVLGEGGMGCVLLASDLELERQVAIKVLRRPDNTNLLHRFRREAEIMARLEHPNLVRLLDLNVDAETPYLVMEYLRGRDLSVPPAPDPGPTMLEVGKALAAIHAAQLLHRDVKPANVLVTESGRVVLVDLGLATGAGVAPLTRTGQVIGTMAFLPPEVFRGSPMSPSSDWYAWGATLYALVEGRSIVQGMEARAVLSGEPRPEPTFQAIEPDSPVAEAIRRTLEQDPERRLRSLSEVRQILDRDAAPEVSSEACTVALDEAPPAPTAFQSAALALVPEPPTRRSAWGLAVAACIGILAWGAAPRFPALDPPPEPILPALPLEDLSLASAILEELALARDLVVTPSGRRVPSSQRAPEDHPVLSVDPLHHADALRALPTLWELLRAHAEDHTLDRLPKQERRALLELDEELLADLGEPVFEAYLAPPDAAGHAVPVSTRYAPTFRAAAEVATLRGRWTVAALQAFEEARSQLEHWEAEFQRDPNAFIESRELLAVGQLTSSLSYPRYVSGASAEPVYRIPCRDRMLRGVRAYRRALALAGRALEAGEPDEAVAGVAFVEYAMHLRTFSYSGVSMLPPELQLGVHPTRPATWGLYAEILQRSATTRYDFDPGRPPPAAQLFAAWAHALEASPEAKPELTTWRRFRVFERMSTFTRKLGHEEKAIPHFRRALAWLEPLEVPPADWVPQVLRNLAEDPDLAAGLGERDTTRYLTLAQRLEARLPEPERDR
jgi:serine/threonine protein kinase/uncharacterized protein YjiS (DUF1127 family)